MDKTLILIRHAHRDTSSGRHIDNGLSAKGKKQALGLIQFFDNHPHYNLKFEGSIQLYSSPKIRCQETLQPVADYFSHKIEIDKTVGEGDSLTNKIKKFFDEWVASNTELTIVCSHGDWIPEFVQFSTGARILNNKGSLVEISGPSSAPYLISLSQGF